MHEQVCLYQGHEAIPLADIISSVFPACADPNSTGPGWVLSQTQTEAQTGASHQSDVWKQLREGEGWMDWWIDGWGGRAWEEKWGRGKWGHLVFLNCLNSQPNCSMLDRTDSRSSSCISNQSISNLFVSWWIDWLEDRLAGWDPNYLHLVDFWGGKLISKPMRIHLLRNFESFGVKK